MDFLVWLSKIIYFALFLHFIQVYKANKVLYIKCFSIYLIEFISEFPHQQQPPFFLSPNLFPAPGFLILVLCECYGFGADVATLPFISLVIVVKASSTLSDSLADVSKNLTLKWSASSFASWYGTYLWSSRSFLFPTRILEIFS